MLKAAARDERARLNKRVDHRLVGVTLFAVIVDHALAFKAQGVACEEPCVIDCEGNRGIDPPGLKVGAILAPDIKVLAAVAGRGVDKARCPTLR